jgi:hypothetical protein
MVDQAFAAYPVIKLEPPAHSFPELIRGCSQKYSDTVKNTVLWKKKCFSTLENNLLKKCKSYALYLVIQYLIPLYKFNGSAQAWSFYMSSQFISSCWPSSPTLSFNLLQSTTPSHRCRWRPFRLLSSAPELSVPSSFCALWRAAEQPNEKCTLHITYGKTKK